MVITVFLNEVGIIIPTRASHHKRGLIFLGLVNQEVAICRLCLSPFLFSFSLIIRSLLSGLVIIQIRAREDGIVLLNRIVVWHNVKKLLNQAGRRQLLCHIIYLCQNKLQWTNIHCRESNKGLLHVFVNFCLIMKITPYFYYQHPS